MRACSPTGSASSKYLSQIEESEWMNQLSSVIQLAAAISDLLDSQGSSVMVCLEEGMDATAQVSCKYMKIVGVAFFRVFFFQCSLLKVM